MSGTQPAEGRRRVVWDEDNLEKNAEYQRLHPVTMHIDEPKTPFVCIEDEDAEAQDRGEELTWDPSVNALARQVKATMANEPPSGPVAPISKSGRPMLHPQTTTGELEEEVQERQFKQMRKAVYADEGAKFKALLAQQHADEEEDEGEEGGDQAEEASGGEGGRRASGGPQSQEEKQRQFKEKAKEVHRQQMPDA